MSQGEDAGRALAYGKRRRGDDWRELAGEPGPVQGELALQHWVIPGDYRVEASGDGSHDCFGARGAHLADYFHLAAQLFLPQGTIGVEHDFDRFWIVECSEKSGA